MKTCRMVRIAVILLALLAVLASAPVLPASDQEFNAIVAKLSSHYQKRPMRFMGLLNFIANRVKPSGVSGMKMAIFEDLNPDRRLSGDGVDEFILAAATRGRFLPFVRVKSREWEQTHIYARETAGKFEMLIISMEQDEAVVLKMRLHPEAMAQWIEKPVHKGKESAQGSGHAPAE